MNFNRIVLYSVSFFSLYSYVPNIFVPSQIAFAVKIFFLCFSVFQLYILIGNSRLNLTPFVAYGVLIFHSFFVFVLIRSLLSSYGVTGFIYHYQVYLGYAPLFLSIYHLYKKGHVVFIQKYILYVFYLICIMLCGVIADGLLINFGNHFLSFIPNVDADGTIRANFLLESPTNVFLYVATGLVICFTNKYSKLVVNLFFFMSLLAAFFALSRLPLLLTILSILLYLIYEKSYKSLILLLVPIFFLVPYFLQNYASFFVRLFLLADLEEASNVSRFDTYKRFWSHIETSDLHVKIFGSGLGASSSNLNDLFFNKYVGHFESSILSIGVELGMFTMITFLIFAIWIVQRNLRYSFVVGVITLFYIINISLVPNLMGYEAPFLFLIIIFVTSKLYLNSGCKGFNHNAINMRYFYETDASYRNQYVSVKGLPDHA